MTITNETERKSQNEPGQEQEQQPFVPPKALSHSVKLQHSRRSDSFSGADLKIFIKDVSDPHAKKRPITVKTWSTIKDVKDVIQKLLSIPPSLQRLYFGPFMTSGISLPNHRTLHDAGIYKNGQVLYLEIKGLPSTSSSSTTTTKKQVTVHDLSTLKQAENDICISKAMFDTTPKLFKSIIKQCRIALAYGIKPVLVLDGSGGTYFLHDIHKRKIAVFKPADEEPYAVNNPRGYIKSGSTTTTSSSKSGFYSDDAFDEDDTLSMRAGIKPGEACLREVAAFLLDENGFSGVPMTTLVEARHYAFHSNGSMLKLNQGGAAVGSHALLPSASFGHSISSISTLSTAPSSRTSSLSSSSVPETSINKAKKVGSCQEFISSECTMDDMSPSKLTKEEVHKIAILDIRILNADRNTANLLCRRNPENPDSFELVPIDHGYCLRTVADVCWFDWCWLDWPQMKEPLSPHMREYVLNLDIEKDARMLREKLDIPKGALDYFRASSKLLQQGVKAGLTLYEIAILCCRNDDAGEKPSKLEMILSMAADIAKSAVDNGRWHHAAASRALEQQLSPDNVFLSSRSTSKASTNRQASIGMSIFKSASSVNFSSFTNGSPLKHNQDSKLSSLSMDNSAGFDFEDIPSKGAPTILADSSGSESSADAVEVHEADEEECEKWAADFIAEAFSTTPIAIPNASRRQRSVSIVNSESSDESFNSDDSSQLSKSPVGFWFVPPSASKSHNAFDDQDDMVWSPQVSPATSSETNVNNFNLNRDRAVKFDIAIQKPPSNLQSELSSMSIREQDENIKNGNILNSKQNLDLPEAPPPMKRSLSYSAFSFKRIYDLSAPKSSTSGVDQSSILSDECEMYYQKFIDLLIDRETTTKTKKPTFLNSLPQKI